MNLIVAQSGGPTSVINSSLCGVIDAGILEEFDNIYLSRFGIEGLIKGEIVSVDKDKFIKNNIKDKLMARPSSILGSCRFKLSDDFTDEVYKKIFDRFEEYDISSFVYIGGNDSMDTVSKLNSYMRENSISGINIVGCPKTIDNDLCQMDHSPGFASAAKFINQTISQMRLDVDVYKLKSVTFVEIMGRNAGWLAGSSLLSNYNRDRKVVNLLYLPEDDKSIDEILDDIKISLKEESNLIVAVAEGFMDRDKILLKESISNTADGFSHKVIAGVANRLADIVRDKLNIKSRNVELNICQRTNTIISKTDSLEAYQLGFRAASISKEKTNLLPIIKREESNDYKINYSFVASEEIANKERKIPQEWLDDRNLLEEKMIAYTYPLIQGEVSIAYENGLPVFVNLCDFIK